MIGLRTVGCCVHVATLINLGKYKYTPFKLPAIYLDSVLAKMDQPSNFPIIVRNKRISRRREAASSSEDDSTDSYASSDHDDSDYFESDFTDSDSDIVSRPLEYHSSSDDDSEDNDNYEESVGLSAHGEIPTISASQMLHSLNEPVSQLSRTESAASGMLLLEFFTALMNRFRSFQEQSLRLLECFIALMNLNHSFHTQNLRLQLLT